MERTGILIGKDSIKAAIGIDSDKLFQRFISKGMPAKIIGGRWYAHVDNLDRYFRNITDVKNKGKIPKDAE